MHRVKNAARGFTLVEILVATAVMAMATTIAVSTFFVVSRAYRHGTAMAENLHYGDFLMDQLVLALRSAYHPEAAQGSDSAYGFWLENGGGGPHARDRISWVKTGRALVGERFAAGVPHRVDFGVENDQDGNTVAAVRFWRAELEAEDFKRDAVPVTVVSRRVRGFECRVADDIDEIRQELVWEDQWEQTNRIPPAVKLTLYLEPIENGADPILVRRVVGLPIAPLSWQ